MTEEPITFRHYLEILARRKWLVLPVVVLVPLVVLAITINQPARYKSSADDLLNRQNLAANLTDVPDTTSLQDPQRFGQTQAELARVPAIAARVLKATGVTSMSAVSFLGTSSVTPHPNADLLTFSVESHSPSLAERLATEYGRQFAIYRAELDNGYLLAARRDAQARLAELQQHGQITSPLATSLQDRISKIGTLLALQSPTATLVSPADSVTQVAPRPMRNGLLALAVSLVLGIALAFFAEAMDTRVSNPDDIADGLGLPVVGRIPPSRAPHDAGPALLIDPEGPQAEAFRMLRTKLEFANLDRGARAIMVSSGSDGEGKTTTALNLALALARSGSHVILSDLDAQNPQLANWLGIPQQPGIVDVALRHARLDDALVPFATQAPSPLAASTNGGDGHGRGAAMQILPYGSFIADGGDVLRSEAVAKVIAALRERADYVIVDAPPLLEVADALTLSTRVDALLIVARVSAIRRPMLKELRRVLETSSTPKVGLVVTGAGAGSVAGGYGARQGSALLKEPAKTWFARRKPPAASRQSPR